jgi:hypothetical protein
MIKKVEKLLETMGAPATEAGSAEEGDYGVVAITGGKYKGKLGYYDNEEGRQVVIYLGVPFASPYVMIYRKHMRAPTTEELARWNTEVMNDVNVAREWKETEG